MRESHISLSPERPIGPKDDSALAARVEHFLQHLCESMMMGTPIVCIDNRGDCAEGVVQMIERESGSGRHYNVVLDNGRKFTVRVS